MAESLFVLSLLIESWGSDYILVSTKFDWTKEERYLDTAAHKGGGETVVFVECLTHVNVFKKLFQSIVLFKI